MQRYSTASRSLLTQAFEELSAGDTQQASEKGWGAAAQIVKAVAHGRGLRESREHLNKSLPPDGGRLGWGAGAHLIANTVKLSSEISAFASMTITCSEVP